MSQFEKIDDKTSKIKLEICENYHVCLFQDNSSKIVCYTWKSSQSNLLSGIDLQWVLRQTPHYIKYVFLLINTI